MSRLPQTERHGADGWNNLPEWARRGVQLIATAGLIALGYLILFQGQ